MELVLGRFCGWCTGFISQKKLDAENDGKPRGYPANSREEAQVVSFNGLLASQAVSEALQIITGYAPVTEIEAFKKYDGVEGTLVLCRVKKIPDCEHCRGILAAGSVIWH